MPAVDCEAFWSASFGLGAKFNQHVPMLQRFGPLAAPPPRHVNALFGRREGFKVPAAVAVADAVTTKVDDVVVLHRIYMDDGIVSNEGNIFVHGLFPLTRRRDAGGLVGVSSLIADEARIVRAGIDRYSVSAVLAHEGVKASHPGR